MGVSKEERRQIILEALQPDANLSKIAREHGMVALHRTVDGS